MTTMVMNAAAEPKLKLHSSAPVYVTGAGVSNQDQAVGVNQYVEPGDHRATVEKELTKLEQIVEYLKVIYR